MDLKRKIKYTNIQIKLFDYINQVDELMELYMRNSNKVSYTRIFNLYKIINNLMIHSEKIKASLIY